MPILRHSEDPFPIATLREVWPLYRSDAAERPPGDPDEIQVLTYYFTRRFALAWRAKSKTWRQTVLLDTDGEMSWVTLPKVKVREFACRFAAGCRFFESGRNSLTATVNFADRLIKEAQQLVWPFPETALAGWARRMLRLTQSGSGGVASADIASQYRRQFPHDAISQPALFMALAEGIQEAWGHVEGVRKVKDIDPSFPSSPVRGWMGLELISSTALGNHGRPQATSWHRSPQRQAIEPEFIRNVSEASGQPSQFFQRDEEEGR